MITVSRGSVPTAEGGSDHIPGACVPWATFRFWAEAGFQLTQDMGEKPTYGSDRFSFRLWLIRHTKSRANPPFFAPAVPAGLPCSERNYVKSYRSSILGVHLRSRPVARDQRESVCGNPRPRREWSQDLARGRPSAGQRRRSSRGGMLIGDVTGRPVQRLA